MGNRRIGSHAYVKKQFIKSVNQIKRVNNIYLCILDTTLRVLNA